jgi:hypothetical protein
VVVTWHNGQKAVRCSDGLGFLGSTGIAMVLLDLARSECRDRVARVLAGRYRDHIPIRYAACVLCGVDEGYLWLGDFDVCFAPDDASTQHSSANHVEVVPGLAKINVNDPTLGPDGSRLVDAQALLVVAQAVLHG